MTLEVVLRFSPTAELLVGLLTEVGPSTQMLNPLANRSF